ncbi:MAG: hypothetical protein HY775_06730 [Acidobacteria bacterium]|nr:hypothetical protein [Acidobacteriota bacterium]
MTRAGEASCAYSSTRPGDIAAFGDWRVEVLWSGSCESRTLDWVRSNSGGGNNVAGLAGTWEGSIAPESCAKATVLALGSAVIVGRTGA